MRLATRIVLIGLSAGIVPAPPAAADHDGYGGGYYEEDRYGSEDRNRNRGRDRGAFSPDFQDSPVTIIICPPGTQYCGSDGGRSDAPPPE